jgi:16S rRNA (guanine966-N2)-methyltransferase
MRIVSGEYKGRRSQLAVPPGVRPTADAVRETIFNILDNYIEFDDMQVLDICAGTGFLGFEAISRGAAHCTFIEKSRRTADFITKNAEIIKIAKDKFTIIVSDAVKAINKLSDSQSSFDLIFFDPPYQAGIEDNVIASICKSNIIHQDTTIVIEHSSLISPHYPDTWELLTSRVFGETQVDIFAIIQN